MHIVIRNGLHWDHAELPVRRDDGRWLKSEERSCRLAAGYGFSSLSRHEARFPPRRSADTCGLSFPSYPVALILDKLEKVAEADDTC